MSLFPLRHMIKRKKVFAFCDKATKLSLSLLSQNKEFIESVPCVSLFSFIIEYDAYKSVSMMEMHPLFIKFMIFNLINNSSPRQLISPARSVYVVSSFLASFRAVLSLLPHGVDRDHRQETKTSGTPARNGTK